MRDFRHDLTNVFQRDGVAPGQKHCLADDVFEFADVSRPGLVAQKFQGVLLDGRGLDAEFGAVFLKEISNESGNVLSALPQTAAIARSTTFKR